MTEMPTISVTELVTAFKEIIETALPPVCVEAEISNCKRSAAGHYYLTLKDDNSEIGAVIWKATAARLKFQPKDGLRVLATGALQVYVARGTCQFIINRLQPQGVGELELALRQLKQKLESEGLFAPERKRPLPVIPRRIALVTSPTSAAVRDMIQVITRRWPAANLIILPVPVQGDGAAPRIARAISSVEQIPNVDVVITGRGGGSLEDLWAFNEEVVARAIADCAVPVVSAVGHEVDVSIADLVADRRALTPSEAGELVVPSAADLRQGLRQSAARLYQIMSGQVERLKQQLEGIGSRNVFQRPMSMIDERRQRCDDAAGRADRAIRLQVERIRQCLAATTASLDALSPLSVLARGYSLTTNAEGTLVNSVGKIEDGSEIQVRVSDGVIRATVREKH
ncbi:MAG: exodeoxyribonuclease VII large subunit [Fuerstiella sp.]|jgi:exodeoxyribonuclease VII large subunit|nr:exodeoxyribonuclease VII large subunit [Fuerstiella sp.]